MHKRFTFLAAGMSVAFFLSGCQSNKSVPSNQQVVQSISTISNVTSPPPLTSNWIVKSIKVIPVSLTADNQTLHAFHYDIYLQPPKASNAVSYSNVKFDLHVLLTGKTSSMLGMHSLTVDLLENRMSPLTYVGSFESVYQVSYPKGALQYLSQHTTDLLTSVQFAAKG